MNNSNVNDSVNFVKGNIKNGADCYFKLLLKIPKGLHCQFRKPVTG